jgi:hypothetical protein
VHQWLPPRKKPHDLQTHSCHPSVPRTYKNPQVHTPPHLKLRQHPPVQRNATQHAANPIRGRTTHLRPDFNVLTPRRDDLSDPTGPHDLSDLYGWDVVCFWVGGWGWWSWYVSRG